MPLTQDPRVADYLDDKLQTTADLESLDSLLLALRDQQSKLKQQLDEAQRDLAQAKQTEQEHSKSLRARVKAFDRDQSDIDKKLRGVTKTKTSEEAIWTFEKSIDKLTKLTVAKEYVRLVQDVDILSDQCLSNLGTSDSTTLNAYQELRNVAHQLEILQINADGAAPHLLDHVIAKYTYVARQMEKVFAGRLKAVLKQIAWPNPDAVVPEVLRDDFDSAIERLLALQRPDLEIRERQNDGTRMIQPLVLLPLKVLLEPLELGFRYHFEGDRPTNRLERPEFFLSHVTERILAKYVEFVEIYIQPVLLRQFRSTELGLNYCYIDASSALVTAVLPMLRNKLFSILPQIKQQPPLLSHLIHELTKFDTELRDEWQYDGGSRGEIWRGLAFEVLAKDKVFAQWLTAEKDFALARYQEIIDAPDSFELDFDSLGAGKTKPSKAAIRLNDLLETTTDNYRELVSFQQKLRFLVDIQISIFDLFHQRLADGLSAYIARTSTIMGGDRHEQAQLQGVAGLERLCRIFGSADYLEKAMRDWNDDVFFLELWSELQHRTSSKTSQDMIAGPLTVADVAARTSSTIHSEAGTPAEEIDPDFENGALFDETAAAYNRLRLRTEDIIAGLLTNNVRQGLTAYTRVNTWSSLATVSQAGDSQPSTSAELDSFMQNVKGLLSYLARAVGTVPLRRLAKPMLQTIQNTIFNQIMLVQLFSGAGAAALRIDITAIIGLLVKYLDRNLVDASFVKLEQAVELLNLPIRGSISSQQEITDKEETDYEGDSSQIGLFEAGRRLFEGSGDEAKSLLEELSLDSLTIGEARKILSHRIELGS